MKTTFTYGENTLSPSSPRPELSNIPPTKEKAKQYFSKLEQEILTLTRLSNDSCGGSPSCDTEEPLFCIRAFNLYDGRAICSGNYHSYSNAKRITETIVKLLVAAENIKMIFYGIRLITIALQHAVKFFCWKHNGSDLIVISLSTLYYN